MSRSIDDLTPGARQKCNNWLWESRKQLKPLGLGLILTETYRPQEVQNALYAKGRTTKGPIVTWTRKSKHTERRAWDCAFRLPDGSLTWNGPWALLGKIAKSFGITWGADITNGIDRCHFQV